ncbi:MAG: methionine--tRNA ligase [Campylobacterales bacterium]|nr:methionine--tRNA ligase [Campylobacterales bacterium]
MKKFYVTTPIYYVNDVAHIGHAYTTIITDTIARYERLRGKDVFFLTGTDEHGQKIEEAAKARGRSTQEYADEVSGKFKALWDDFGISYDKYIRTTDAEHKAGVQKAFDVMYEKGDIYKDEYEGHYCVSCETFFTETQLVGGEQCPDCGKEVRVVKEESYFFRLSNYQDKLLKWYEENEKAILPKSRKNEVKRFVEGGLTDLSITRTSFDWGVKLPEKMNDPKHVVYVWLDALMNYATALGFGTDDKNMDYFPADYHLIGKDILRFHAIFWPSFLMSLDLPLPKHVAAHGWWTRDGAKMSKSKGNVIDPKEVAEAYGLDNFRYFMLREVPFGQDGDFAQKALMDRINSDLGNDLGNLLNRIIGMSGKYFDSKISSQYVNEYFKADMAQVDEIIGSLDGFAKELQLNRYLEELWKVLAIGNKKIEEVQPWTKMKENGENEVSGLLGLIANILAKASLALSPIMPEKTKELAKALNIEIDTVNFTKLVENKELLEDFTIEKIPPLFPRIEEPLMKEAVIEEETKPEEPKDPQITFDDFLKVVTKVGVVVSAEEVPKSKKLLLLQVDIGEAKPRQVVAGIKEFYAPADLINTQVCLVSNLKPAKLMGNLSEGMVLAAKDENGLKLVRPEKDAVIGTVIS